ncbi:MAG: cupredoxin domain-containing protein [bacterium]|nr:cupredoxin domain-containing protein [bacterium]
MNKIVLWVLAVVIVAGGWFLYSSAPAQESADTEVVAGGVVAPQAVSVEGANTNVTEVVSKVPDIVITFTDSGFVPSSLTVKKGQTVRWANNSGSKVWPASAVHPTHGVYPQKSASDCLGSSFDACRALSQGESWDFTFDYVGEWKFHNHLNGSQKGSVIVTE